MAGTAALVQEVPHDLGEDGVDIDVTAAAKGIAAGAAQQMAPSRRTCARRRESMPVEPGVVRLQRLDHPFAGGRVWCIRDLGISLGEPFLFLELHPFPRGVPEDAVEAAVVEDFGEGEVPVEELVVVGEPFDFLPLFGGQGLGVGLESTQGVGGDALGWVAAGRPRLDEGGAPGVGDSLALAVGRGAGQGLEPFFLALHFVQGVVRNLLDPSAAGREGAVLRPGLGNHQVAHVVLPALAFRLVLSPESGA